MPLQKLVAIGPPGSNISIGPTSLDAPAWVQAVGSILAILIAVWLSHRESRKTDRDQISDSACFASYIKDFLAGIGKTINDIADSINEDREAEDAPRRQTLSGVCAQAFQAYDEKVTRRMAKLVELPLTDWPDIEFANAFYDANLRMQSSLTRLKVETELRVKEEIEQEVVRLRDQRAAFQARSYRDQEEEDAAEEYLGDQDDDEVVALPPRGQVRSFVSRRIHERADDDREYDLQNAMAADDKWIEDCVKAELSAQERFDRESLDKLVFSRLRKITNDWTAKDALLCSSIERNIQRAKDAGVASTYASRAERKDFFGRARLHQS